MQHAHLLGGQLRLEAMAVGGLVLHLAGWTAAACASWTSLGAFVRASRRKLFLFSMITLDVYLMPMIAGGLCVLALLHPLTQPINVTPASSGLFHLVDLCGLALANAVLSLKDRREGHPLFSSPLLALLHGLQLLVVPWVLAYLLIPAAIQLPSNPSVVLPSVAQPWIPIWTPSAGQQTCTRPSLYFAPMHLEPSCAIPSPGATSHLPRVTALWQRVAMVVWRELAALYWAFPGPLRTAAGEPIVPLEALSVPAYTFVTAVQRYVWLVYGLVFVVLHFHVTVMRHVRKFWGQQMARVAEHFPGSRTPANNVVMHEAAHPSLPAGS